MIQKKSGSATMSMNHNQLVGNSFLDCLGTSPVDRSLLNMAILNAFKGPNLSTIDPLTGGKVDVYNPRTDEWSKHFAIDIPETTNHGFHG